MKTNCKTSFVRAAELMALLAAGLSAVSCLGSPPPAGAKPVYDFSAVTRCVQGWVDSGYYPGAAVLVAKDNKVIYEKCFGNYSPDTQVLIASSGKWLAAATIMSLVDEGKLSLDDTPSKWLPEFKNDPKDKATLRQLLSHSSGYPAYQPKDKPVDKYQTLVESVEHIMPLPPDHQPGEHFDYGGLAMQVAGRMAEAASGQDWETLFQERIAKPCGMTNTHFTPVDQGGGHSPMLGGGARSTLNDYANFLVMIFNDGVFDGKRVLSKNAMQEMQADQVRGALVKPGEFAERVRGAKFNGIYGLGEWREQLDGAGNAVLISSPSWAGAYPWIDKTTGVYGVILAHVEGPNVGRDQFSGFFSSPVLVAMVRDVVAGSTPAAAEHPRLLVKPSDRQAIQAKLEQSPWAKESYTALKARVDSCLEHCQTNEQFMSSRLFMNWQTNYTTPIVRNSRTVGGEGNAPVPTPRFGGARDWATKYQPPAKLEDLKPYNDTDGKVWLFNKETGKEEWADPSQTGRMFETVNERIIQTAADAGFVYWVTGDEKYAKYASEILWTYMNGFSYMQPPKIVEGGGANVIGFDSFEVIHEDIVTPLAESYDFVCDYLQKQGRDVKLIQTQFKRMADRVIDGGNAAGNWNLNQARIIAYAGLPLEDNANYPDGKGRQYYVDVMLNARLPAQTGLTRVIKEGYDQATGIWPEAPGYSFGTTKDIVLMATLVSGDPAGRALLADPILQRALAAQINLTYPNGFAAGFGDTVNPRVNTIALELLIADARERSDAELEARLTAALNREIATGNYNRSDNPNLVALTKYVGELKEVPRAAANDQRTFFGQPLNVLMQRNNGEDAGHSLAAALFGTAGGHVHANGLAMELYGAGLILGADPGRGVSYWQPEHAQYYSQPPAHNTVIVNGKSDYGIGRDQIPMRLDWVEPDSGEKGISPDVGFAQASFHYNNPEADQQRTLALIRVGPRSGFYFDVFRSRAKNATNSFHDYLYHNIGQSLALTGDKGKPLALSATKFLSSSNGCLQGYDYFKDEKSAGFSGNLDGIFSAQLPDGSRCLMKVWMPGSKGRRVFSVAAPGDHAAREESPAFAETPMPTLIVRQRQDAWQQPFVAVYEPSLGSDQAAIRNVRAAKVDGRDAGLAACVVEGQTVTDGRREKFSVLLAQDDQPGSEKHFEGFHLRGSFGVIIKREGIVAELYLGHGWTLGGSDVSLKAMGDSPVDAAMIYEGAGWRYSSSSSLSASLVFSRPENTAKVKEWKLLRTDTGGGNEVDSVKIHESRAAGRKILVVEGVLSAGNDVRLSLEPAQR